MTTRIFIAAVFFLGLIYLLWPGPGSIGDIPPIPNSLKSDEPGDTTQNQNIAAYFSLQKRDVITNFYYDQFHYLNVFGFKIPPIKFNHPVENAQVSVRDQVRSTYLEEYAYPFRDSLFVNGYDKEVWNKLNHIQNDTKNETIEINGEMYSSKTTVRYYHSSIITRIIIYIGVWLLCITLAKVTYKAFKKY